MWVAWKQHWNIYCLNFPENQCFSSVCRTAHAFQQKRCHLFLNVSFLRVSSLKKSRHCHWFLFSFLFFSATVWAEMWKAIGSRCQNSKQVTDPQDVMQSPSPCIFSPLLFYCSVLFSLNVLIPLLIVQSYCQRMISRPISSLHVNINVVQYRGKKSI